MGGVLASGIFQELAAKLNALDYQKTGFGGSRKNLPKEDVGKQQGIVAESDDQSGGASICRSPQHVIELV